MHVLLKILALACAVAYVYAAAAIYPYEPKPAKFHCQEGCYLGNFDIVIPYNESYYPKGLCQVYKCKTNNEKEWYSCGVIAVPRGCRVVQDLSKKYPDCCGQLVCDITTEAPSSTKPSTTEPSTTEPSTTEPSTTNASTCEY